MDVSATATQTEASTSTTEQTSVGDDRGLSLIAADNGEFSCLLMAEAASKLKFLESGGNR